MVGSNASHELGLRFYGRLKCKIAWYFACILYFSVCIRADAINFTICQIQNFLKQGGAVSLQPPPGGQLPGPLRTPRSQSVLPTIQNWMTPMHKQRGRGCGVGAAALFPIFWWQLGEMSHSGEFTIGHQSLKHGIRAWNLWWKWYKLENSVAKLCEFYPRRKQVSWTFKVLKPTSFRGLCTLDPRQGRPPDPTRGPKELLKLLNKSW